MSPDPSQAFDRPGHSGPGSATSAEPLRATLRLLLSLGEEGRHRDPAQAASCLRQAAALAATLDDALPESRAWCLLGSMELTAGRYAEAEEALERGREAAERGVDAASAIDAAAAAAGAAGAKTLPGAATGTDVSSLLDDARRQRCSAWNTLGLLRLRQGRMEDGLARLRASLSSTTECATGPSFGPVRAETLEYLGLAYTLRGESQQALRYYEEALELRRAGEDAAAIARDLNQLGNLRHRMGQYAEAVACYRQALDGMRALGDLAAAGGPRSLAATLNNLASTLLRLGELAEARGLFEECLERFRALGDEARISDVLANLGLLAQAEGRWPEAERCYREVLDCKRALGDPAGASNCLTNLAHLSIARGRYQDALAHSDESQALLAGAGIDGTLAPALVTRGLALLELHRLEEARAAAEEAEALARRAQADDQRAEAEALRGQLALATAAAEEGAARARSLDASFRAAQAAVQLAERTEDPELIAYASRVLAASCIERDALEEAKQAITRAGRLMRGWTSSFERARVLFEEGRLLARSGSADGAAERLRRVQREFQQVGNPHWQLQAWLHLAAVTQEIDPEQAKNAEGAARLLIEAHGLHDLANRIRCDVSRLSAGRAAAAGVDASTGAPSAAAGTSASAPRAAASAIPTPADLRRFLEDAGPTLELAWYEPLLEGLVRRAESWAGDREVRVRLGHLLGRVLDRLQEELEREELGVPPPGEDSRFEFMVGATRPMREIYRLVRQVAPTDSTVLVLGESGTGKELVARSLHARSQRADQPFVAIDCPSIPKDLLESELFGHERGAFTGATEARPGKLELAHGGTVFLDEIGDMAGPTQAKLLRFLQEREFERVGGRRPIRVDVRMVAATSRDLAAAIRAGEFREDLFYRLNVVPVQMPPLRDRREDLPLLAEHFLCLLAERRGRPPARVTMAALEVLRHHDWPGNVRELRNTLEYMYTVSGGDVLDLRHVPAALRRCWRGAADSRAPARDAGPSGGAGSGTGVDARGDAAAPIRPGETLESRLICVEAALIRSTLEQEGWNQSAAARRLGITESMIRNRIRQYAIQRPRVAAGGTGETG